LGKSLEGATADTSNTGINNRHAASTWSARMNNVASFRVVIVPPEQEHEVSCNPRHKT
jgi:hypothetical protein